MNKFGLVLFLILPICAFAQNRVTIKGTITQANTNTPIYGANILIPQTGYGTTTDSLGNYEMTILKGSFLIKITHQGYFSKNFQLDATKNATQNFTLDEKVNDLAEIEVSAKSANQNVKSLTTGVSSLNYKALKKLPTLLGEVDIIKSLFTLPGVTTVGEGASGFNVRGGNIDQNLILLEEAPIFNSSHLMGFFSVFNPDAFRDFNFYRGGVPAQFGGRVSSVLSVNLKDANASKFSINGGVGTISSRLFIESPIIKDKLSFFVAGRISYVDQVVNLFKIKRLSGSKANFYDVTAKVEYKPTKKDRISISAFIGNDNFKLAKDTISTIDENSDARYHWTSRNLSTSWSHYFGPKFTLKTHGIFANYDVDIINTDSASAFTLSSSIAYKSLKSVLIFTPNEKHEAEIGVQINNYLIKPGSLLPTLETSNKNPALLPDERALESAVFVNDKIKINSKFDMGIGLRFALYQALGSGKVYNYEANQPRSTLSLTDSTMFQKGDVIKQYSSIEPRISFNYSINANSSIKASANRMSQFINLLSNTTAALPSDRWKLSDVYTKPQYSNQFSIGYFRNSKDKTYELSAELFYKQLFNAIDYKDGETLILNPKPETVILQGDGFAYGAELFIKKNLGVLTGWLSYTYSQTLIKIVGDSPEETINNGNYFPPIFNRPHSFNAVGSYQASKTVSFSGNLNFTSGRAITYPASKLFLSGSFLPYYNSRNQSQIPNYFRIDLSMNIETHPYRTKGYRSNWNFSLYNILFRRNAYSVFLRQQTPFNIYDSRVKIYKLSVLGSIIPSLTYNFKF
ncbi:TonB-dependent receptor [Emticicia sediminis]